MRSIPIFNARDDGTHTPDGNPIFQESALFVWHDMEQGIGGFLRLGQEPVVSQLNCCFGVFTRQGQRFRANVTGADMTSADRGDGFMAWGQQIRVDLENLSITANFPECEALLVFEDFFPRYDWFTLINRPVPEGHARQHFEVAGRITGQVRLGDKVIQVNALGYRDRSWGARRWDGIRATRWWPCVFGPDLCAHMIASVDVSGRHGAYGYVMRDGVPLAMTSVDVAATLDYDAISPRSGHARFTLENGESGEFFHERSDGIVLHVRGYTAVESIGTVRWGDRYGMSNLEVCTNPAGGNQPPAVAFGANNSEGLSHRPPK